MGLAAPYVKDGYAPLTASVPRKTAASAQAQITSQVMIGSDCFMFLFWVIGPSFRSLSGVSIPEYANVIPAKEGRRMW